MSTLRTTLIAVALLVGLSLAHFPRDEMMFIVAASMSFLAWHFARHWLAICTASPVSYRDVLAQMSVWKTFAIVFVLVPPGCVLCGIMIADLQVTILLLSSYVVARIVVLRHASPWQSMDTAWGAIESWCFYNPLCVSHPGLQQSPVGHWPARLLVTLIPLVSLTTLVADVRKETVPTDSITFGMQLGDCVLTGAMILFGTYLTVIVMLQPLLDDAARWLSPDGVSADNWHTFIDDLQHSPDIAEARAYYSGTIAADGMPLLIPRAVFNEHGHFLGDSGGGKTGLGLSPWLEQTINFGDASVLIIDGKADTLELLATAMVAAKRVQDRSGRSIPVKHFTNQQHLSTYAFNPLTQSYWESFDPYVKTDILCGAAGLIYGSDYGEGWYSAANAAVLHYAIKHFPEARTFRELADKVQFTLTSAKKKELHPELRAAGVHVQAILDRLGSFDALNVSGTSGHPNEVVRETIDLCDLFRRPQIVYAHLSTTLAPGSSPEIGRFLIYSLLCAATQTERKCQVYLVIDEFQRFVARNVEYMLQLARSMGVGVILANQSMQDMREMIPSLEANCRYRQWFSVSSLDDRERLVKAAGLTVEQFVSRTISSDSRSSRTTSQQVTSRLSINDIALASDAPFESVVMITRGGGYAQFGGLPVIVKSGYHIPLAEYQRRKLLPWPCAQSGSYIPREHIVAQAASAPARTGPLLTTEILQGFDLDPVIQPGPPPREPSRKRRRQET